MKTKINGLHHITAITGDVNETIDFYREILKLKLVKKTVNFEDKYTYHLYFSNKNVDAGTIITFFPWNSTKLGQHGSGQVGRIAFRVGKDHLNFWKERLSQFKIYAYDGLVFGENSIDFTDGHALKLSIVESEEVSGTPDILGFYGSELLSHKPEESRDFFVNSFKFTEETETDTHWVISFNTEYLYTPKVPDEAGKWGVGTVHHIAFEVDNKEDLEVLKEELRTQGYYTSGIKDRKYFTSLYFKEKGGVVIEIATKGPGFTVDEPFEELGKNLMLPEQFEPYREEILEKLRPIRG